MNGNTVATESLRLSEDQALAASREAGCIVAEIVPGGVPIQHRVHPPTEDACCDMARRLSIESPGKTFGVFKLAREYHARLRLAGS